MSNDDDNEYMSITDDEDEEMEVEKAPTYAKEEDIEVTHKIEENVITKNNVETEEEVHNISNANTIKETDLIEFLKYCTSSLDSFISLPDLKCFNLFSIDSKYTDEESNNFLKMLIEIEKNGNHDRLFFLKNELFTDESVRNNMSNIFSYALDKYEISITYKFFNKNHRLLFYYTNHAENLIKEFYEEQFDLINIDLLCKHIDFLKHKIEAEINNNNIYNDDYTNTNIPDSNANYGWGDDIQEKKENIDYISEFKKKEKESLHRKVVLPIIKKLNTKIGRKSNKTVITNSSKYNIINTLRFNIPNYQNREAFLLRNDDVTALYSQTKELDYRVIYFMKWGLEEDQSYDFSSENDTDNVVINFVLEKENEIDQEYKGNEAYDFEETFITPTIRVIEKINTKHLKTVGDEYGTISIKNNRNFEYLFILNDYTKNSEDDINYIIKLFYVQAYYALSNYVYSKPSYPLMIYSQELFQESNSDLVAKNDDKQVYLNSDFNYNNDFFNLQSNDKPLFNNIYYSNNKEGSSSSPSDQIERNLSSNNTSYVTEKLHKNMNFIINERNHYPNDKTFNHHKEFYFSGNIQLLNKKRIKEYCSSLINNNTMKFSSDNLIHKALTVPSLLKDNDNIEIDTYKNMKEISNLIDDLKLIEEEAKVFDYKYLLDNNMIVIQQVEEQSRLNFNEFIKSSKLSSTILNKVSKISLGLSFSAILTTNNTLYSFGFNHHGQLGLGIEDKTYYVSHPTHISTFQKDSLDVYRNKLNGKNYKIIDLSTQSNSLLALCYETETNSVFPLYCGLGCSDNFKYIEQNISTLKIEDVNTTLLTKIVLRQTYSDTAVEIKSKLNRSVIIMNNNYTPEFIGLNNKAQCGLSKYNILYPYLFKAEKPTFDTSIEDFSKVRIVDVALSDERTIFKGIKITRRENDINDDISNIELTCCDCIESEKESIYCHYLEYRFFACGDNSHGTCLGFIPQVQELETSKYNTSNVQNNQLQNMLEIDIINKQFTTKYKICSCLLDKHKQNKNNDTYTAKDWDLIKANIPKINIKTTDKNTYLYDDSKCVIFGDFSELFGKFKSENIKKTQLKKINKKQESVLNCEVEVFCENLISLSEFRLNQKSRSISKNNSLSDNEDDLEAKKDEFSLKLKDIEYSFFEEIVIDFNKENFHDRINVYDIVFSFE